MGYAERRSRRLWDLMRELGLVNRMRVFVSFGNTPTPRLPRHLRGKRGAWWLLTGRRFSTGSGR